jgi:formylglycine-generating enzyme required for sulfatase activity
VYIAELSGGSVTAEPRGGEAGTVIQLTVTEDEGFKLKTGSLKYSDGTKDTVVNASTRKFTLPASDVTVKAEFEGAYTVSVAQGLGDYLTPEPASGPPGTVIHIRLSLPEGWRIKGGTLKYRDGQNETVIDGGTLQFTLPAAHVTVSAVLENARAATRRLVRVPGGTVKSPPSGSVTGGPLSGAKPSSPITVDSFSIGASEVTYDLYWEVKDWASQHGYTFGGDRGREGFYGSNGNPYRGEPTAEHRYDPVTEVSWWDAIVWCNAYSEWAAAQTDPAYDRYNSFEPLYRSAGDAPSPNTVLRNPEETYLIDIVGGRRRVDEPTQIYLDGAKVALPDPAGNPQGFRLPNGAEWEFAARGGDPAAPAWNYPYAGSVNKDEVAWFWNTAVLEVQPVGLKLPNTLGLYDMSGNVEEWASNPADQTKAFLLGGSAYYEERPLSSIPQPLSLFDATRGFRVAAPASVGEAP